MTALDTIIGRSKMNLTMVESDPVNVELVELKWERKSRKMRNAVTNEEVDARFVGYDDKTPIWDVVDKMDLAKRKAPGPGKWGCLAMEIPSRNVYHINYYTIG